MNGAQQQQNTIWFVSNDRRAWRIWSNDKKSKGRKEGEIRDASKGQEKKDGEIANDVAVNEGEYNCCD